MITISPRVTSRQLSNSTCFQFAVTERVLQPRRTANADAGDAMLGFGRRKLARGQPRGVLLW